MAWDKQDDEEWQRYLARAREDSAWAKSYRDSAAEGNAAAQAAQESRGGGTAIKEREGYDADALKGIEEGLKGSSFDNASKNFEKQASNKDLNQAEKVAAAEGGAKSEKAALPGWFRENLSGKALSGMSLRRKGLIGLAAGGALLSLAGGWMGVFNLLNVFQIDHLFRNIEAKAFMRFQVDMEGRTNKWIASYLKVRFAEIEDKELLPQDFDNFAFRAEGENQFDGANPFYVWYGLMRKVVGKPGELAKFEKDLLEREGIRFSSYAYKDGNQVKFRPAVVFIDKEKVFEFELTEAEKNALRNGRTSELNGRISTAIDTYITEPRDSGSIFCRSADCQQRKLISKKVKAYTKPWQFMKRFYLRKSIQNATGVRDWRFFEKTQNRISEKKIEIRNRVVTKMFPESTKSGKFIQCMFGITACRGSTDSADPENRSALASLPNEEGERLGPDGQPLPDTAQDGLTSGVSGEVDNATESMMKKIVTQIASKIGGPAAVISLIDTLNNINNSMQSGAMSDMVYMARSAADIGIYQVYGTISDQARTADVTAEEMNNTVAVVAENGGNSEGWRTLMESGMTSTVSAAAKKSNKINDDPGRTEFCSPEYQEAMALPQNEAPAKKAFSYICPGEKIGGSNLAKDIEDGWKNSIGKVISPILKIYNDSGAAAIVGWFGSAIEKILGPPMQKLASSVLGALGLKDDLDNLMGWIFGKVAAFLGAGPRLPAGAPPGMFVNHAIMGGAASAEQMMRFAGGAATKSLSYDEQQQNKREIAQYQQQQNAEMSLHTKYASLSNPTSVASNTLFAIVNKPFSTTVATAFGSVANLPSILLSGRASAATQTGFEAAEIAGVETNSIPNICKTTEPELMTTAIATNAENLDLLDNEDLSWEVLGNYDSFWQKVYEKAGDDLEKREQVKSVYNCRLFEGIVGGALGARANPETLGPNAYGADAAAAAVPTGDGANLPQGTAQELAQKIVDHPNIRFQLDYQEAAMKYVAANGKGRDCGAPNVDPRLLGLMLVAADKYKMTYGVMVDGHSCNNGFHPRGMAIDINGIVTLDGSKSTANGGNNIRWTGDEMALLKEFYDTMGQTMSTELGGGGFGQIGCFRGVKPVRASGVSYFDDTCHHIHMDIGKR